MNDVQQKQWEAVGKAIATLSGIKWGSVTLVFKEGQFTGLIEMRSTLRTEESNDGG